MAKRSARQLPALGIVNKHCDLIVTSPCLFGFGTGNEGSDRGENGAEHIGR